MANTKHLAKLREGVELWNQWRKQNPEILPDLREANLSNADLSNAYLSGVNLGGANLSAADLRHAIINGADLRESNVIGTDLSEARLREADLRRADLRRAIFSSADLWGANLSEANLSQGNMGKADLSQANLSDADVRGADLSGVNLTGANLMGAAFIDTNLKGANLTGCNVYGISVWKVTLEGAKQSNLVITPWEEPPIQVDNLEVAQFIYLLLNNQKIRSVIDTITSKVVLILGRFTPERKVVLDAIRDELRNRDYTPVLFDFDKPNSRDLTETVSTLAHMARFVIADITDAKSIPQELMAIVPDLPSVPIQPLLLASQSEYAMFEHFRRFPWVLKEVLYDDQPTLLAELSEKVVAPAEAKAKKLATK